MLEKASYRRLSSDVDTTSSVHPATSASWLSLLSFWWMNGIFRMGNERPLAHSDILPLHEEDKARDLTESLQKEWNKHVNELNKNKECKVQPSLWKCIVRTTSLRKISFLTCFVLLESVCRVLQPLFLGLLLHLLRSSERDYSLAYGCCFLLALSGLSTACIHYTGYQLELLGMQLSSAIKGLIYLKVSHLDSKRSL